MCVCARGSGGRAGTSGSVGALLPARSVGSSLIFFLSARLLLFSPGLCSLRSSLACLLAPGLLPLLPWEKHSSLFLSVSGHLFTLPVFLPCHFEMF